MAGLPPDDLPTEFPSARLVASSRVLFVGLQISWRSVQTRTTVLSRTKARFTMWLVGSTATRASLRRFRPFAFLRSSVGHRTLPRHIATAVGGGIVTRRGAFPRAPRPS